MKTDYQASFNHWTIKEKLNTVEYFDTFLKGRMKVVEDVETRALYQKTIIWLANERLNLSRRLICNE